MADDLNPRLAQAHTAESRALNVPNAILPDAWLGMLGGGQLGRMFAHAAQAMGYKVCVLDPDPNSPAGTIAERHICAGYTDEAALAEMAALCPAVTTEFENVPAQALDRLEQLGAFVAPRANCVSITQNRIAEKKFFALCAARTGIHPAPSWVIEHEADIEQLPADILPGILKIARMGYDGKGQARVSTIDELRAAWGAMQHVPCVLEKMLPLAYEVSVLAARAADGTTATWPLAENEHRDGILFSTIMPSRSVSDDIATRTRAAAAMIAEEMGYVGVLCIEFFVLQDGSLIANEMAPRPHNSGHITMDVCETSQFEQQVRAMARLPLGSTRQHSPGRMLNVLGDVWFEYGLERTPAWHEVMGHSGAKVHLYGKADAQVTITAVSNGTTVAKTITLHAPVLRPVASQVTWYAGDAPIALSISPQFTTGTPTWSSTVGGTFSAAQGNSVTFTPAAVTSDTQAVVSVAASNHTESVSITLKPASEKTLTLNTPSVQAGNGSVTLTVPSTISHGTLKWTASIGTITVNADGSATYTPPATLSGATVVTISATDGSSAPFTATISVTPSAALAVSPTVTSASAAGAPVSLTASIVNPNASVSASMVRWAIASGHGSLSATSGATVSYIPDATDTTVNDTAVVTATLGAMQKTVNITLNFQSSARFNTPYAIAVDGSGNLFVGDSGNNTIRKITVPGVVSTFAGSGAGTEADGTGTAASFLIPVGTAFDSSGNLFVADSVGHAIRKVTPAGVVTTLAGTSSTFGSPVGIAVDAAGNIYVADYVTNLLSKITPAGVITTLAGSGTAGSQDGTGTAASFNAPSGVAVDSNGTLYVAEQKGCNIRKVTPAGVVTTLAGTGVCTHTDGTGTAAAFNMPGSLVVDGNGNVYVTEYKGNTVRKITPAGVVTTLAGSGATGSADGLGTSAQFNYPMGIAIDSNGVLYVTETDNNLIRMVSPTGNVSTVAGAAKASGTADGIALPR